MQENSLPFGNDAAGAYGLLALPGECRDDESRFGEVHALFTEEIRLERIKDGDPGTNAYLGSLLLTGDGILVHYLYVKGRGAVAGAATGYRRFVENFMLDVGTHRTGRQAKGRER